MPRLGGICIAERHVRLPTVTNCVPRRPGEPPRRARRTERNVRLALRSRSPAVRASLERYEVLRTDFATLFPPCVPVSPDRKADRDERKRSGGAHRPYRDTSHCTVSHRTVRRGQPTPCRGIGLDNRVGQRRHCTDRTKGSCGTPESATSRAPRTARPRSTRSTRGQARGGSRNSHADRVTPSNVWFVTIGGARVGVREPWTTPRPHRPFPSANRSGHVREPQEGSVAALVAAKP